MKNESRIHGKHSSIHHREGFHRFRKWGPSRNRKPDLLTLLCLCVEGKVGSEGNINLRQIFLAGKMSIYVYANFIPTIVKRNSQSSNIRKFSIRTSFVYKCANKLMFRVSFGDFKFPPSEFPVRLAAHDSDSGIRNPQTFSDTQCGWSRQILNFPVR